MRLERLLTAQGLHLAYGTTDILRGVDLTLEPGADIVVLGRSGSGKTSLLLALAGLLPITAGQINRHDLATGDIGVVFQSPSLLPELSVVENVALPLRLIGSASVREARALAEAALDNLGIDAIDALPGQLSGGQQQRVAVARVLVGRPRVVLADEPTGALDRVSARRVVAALRAHRDRVNGALLIATHDTDVAAGMNIRVMLDDGRLTEEAA